MLTINRLRELVTELVALIPEINSGKVVVTKEEISKFMSDHDTSDNTLLIGIVPEHDVSGSEDALMVENDLGFYLLDKTDYSEHDHDSYLDIFVKVQQTAFDLVQFITDKNSEDGSSFCGLFQNIDDVTFPISPVKGIEGCNGYFVGINFETSF